MLAEQWSWKHPGGLQQQLEQQPNKHKQQQGAQAESLIPATKCGGLLTTRMALAHGTGYQQEEHHK